jgi:hypothetical protein
MSREILLPPFSSRCKLPLLIQHQILLFSIDLGRSQHRQIVPGTGMPQKFAESEVGAKSPIVMFEFEQPVSEYLQIGPNPGIRL